VQHDEGGRCAVSCGSDSEGAAAQVHLSEKTVLREYHPDAEDMLNVSNDLEKILVALRDKTKRFPRQVALPRHSLPFRAPSPRRCRPSPMALARSV